MVEVFFYWVSVISMNRSFRSHRRSFDRSLLAAGTGCNEKESWWDNNNQLGILSSARFIPQSRLIHNYFSNRLLNIKRRKQFIKHLQLWVASLTTKFVFYLITCIRSSYSSNRSYNNIHLFVVQTNCRGVLSSHKWQTMTNVDATVLNG